MKNIFATISICLGFVFLTVENTTILAEETPPTAEELVSKVLAAKKTIQSGEIQMELTTPINMHDRRYEKSITEYSIVFKPEKVKIKHCNVYDNQRGPWIPCQTLVWLNDDSIRIPMQDEYAVYYLTEERRSLSELGAFHPWMIGTYPNRLSFYKNHDFDRTILLPDDAQQVQVEPTEDGNWKIDYLLQDEKREFTGRSRIWIDPKKAYSVLRCESEVHDPQSQFRDVYTTKPKLYGNTWFPEEIRTVRMVAEKVIHEEVIRITKASFNLPISDEEFDWKSFGLPVGREVHHDGNLLYWDGENLTNSFIGPGLPPVEYAGKWRWILILSINILVCGYIAFRLFLKSQKN